MDICWIILDREIAPTPKDISVWAWRQHKKKKERKKKPWNYSFNFSHTYNSSCTYIYSIKTSQNTSLDSLHDFSCWKNGEDCLKYFCSAKIYLTWILETYIDGEVIGAWKNLHSKQKLFM